MTFEVEKAEFEYGEQADRPRAYDEHVGSGHFRHLHILGCEGGWDCPETGMRRGRLGG